MRPLAAIQLIGILICAYGALWGTSQTFFLGIAIAVTAWLIGDCARDVRETGGWDE